MWGSGCGSPGFSFLAQHAATTWVRGTKDVLWCGLCWVLTQQHTVPVKGQVLLGVTWGLCAVLVIALGVRRAGPEHAKVPWAQLVVSAQLVGLCAMDTPQWPSGLHWHKIHLFWPHQVRSRWLTRRNSFPPMAQRLVWPMPEINNLKQVEHFGEWEIKPQENTPSIFLEFYCWTYPQSLSHNTPLLCFCSLLFPSMSTSDNWQAKLFFEGLSKCWEILSAHN